MIVDVLPGRAYPLGATVYEDGVNFSIFSRNCSALELLLFDDADTTRPARTIRLDPRRNRTFYYWHIFVPHLRPGQIYGYRVYGPYAPERGMRFDGQKVLLDPYTRSVVNGTRYEREAAMRPGDNCAHAMRSVVVADDDYDWEGDQPLARPFSESIIYEMHVGGFTQHESSGVAPAKRGTYAGLIEKIPYLRALGITSVELLPVQQFDPFDAPPSMQNYWGYSPIAFFAPHRAYSSDTDPLGPVREFRDMVKALHRAGIEVILDVVFNHTAEGDQRGPTLSFRGLENSAYYLLNPANPAQYANYSGTGNAINGNQSVVRRMIMDCLRFWVQSMHVDGFRFDLASVLARDKNGQPLSDPPVLWDIESDPVLADTKIIAEAWDAAGLYQVGSFVGYRWAEWNGQYRDDVRRFAKGDTGLVGAMAARLTGSHDLFPKPERDPSRSINFVTCHDGFTMNDLVSYNHKHNEANGEYNRDGTDANYSWNCGVEGPTNDPEIEALRVRQIKNMFTTLLLSQGTPMLLMGDEIRRTQYGNNNAYAQNNPMSWFIWEHVETHADLLRFVRQLIQVNQSLRLLRSDVFWSEPGGPHLVWHGVQRNQPDWGQNSHTLALELHNAADHEHLHIMLNAYWEPLTFELPILTVGRYWCRMLDTALPTPHDCIDPDRALPIEQQDTYLMQSRSVVVVWAR